MEQFLDYYGEKPIDIGHIELDTDNVEMCFIQYLPIFIPDQEGFFTAKSLMG